jgi:hypothetical protein
LFIENFLSERVENTDSGDDEVVAITALKSILACEEVKSSRV